MVERTYYFLRGPDIRSHYTYHGSQPSVTPVLWNPIISSGSPQSPGTYMMHKHSIYIHAGKVLIHIK